MRNRIERLRIWLLGSAAFLVLVIAAFVGAAHYLARRRWALPAGLGVNVVRETNGYTYCQSMQGKTVYCIHAAKALEHSDGKTALHDVSIELYGEKQDRNDRIYGDEFEYDQNAGLIRAMGLVHIDLQAAAAAGGQAATAKTGAGATAKVLHVTTRELVYMQKLGIAATNQYIEFQSGGMTGHATGADYNSDTGQLMLHSAVSMSGLSGKRPVTVTAGTAKIDNRNQETFLTQARYVSPGQRVDAEQATLHTRPDGTLTRVEAKGDVRMEANGATAVSQQADVALNAQSQPESAVLTGGVRYMSDGPLRQMSGAADAATITFDTEARPQAKDAVFTGAVHMTERTRATVAAREPWSTRELTAAKVAVALAPTDAGRPQLRDAEATGSAHLVDVDKGSVASSRGAGTTELSADDLKAHWIGTGDAKLPPQLDTVAGRGHTALRQVGADGLEQTSTGDALDAQFRPRASAGTTANSAASTAKAQPARGAAASPSSPVAGSSMGGVGLDDLWRAVQQGHVEVTRVAPSKAGNKSARGGPSAGATTRAGAGAQPDVERATAQRAVYDGDLDRVTLTGGVEMSDAGSALWADRVAMDRATGDAQAQGSVKVNYAPDDSAQSGAGPGSAPTQGAATEPTHILAQRAVLIHASREATFYGSPVRLWQGGSQVQAPEIELMQAEQRLIARGGAVDSGAAAGKAIERQAGQVHTVLVSTGSGPAGAAKAGAAKGTMERSTTAKATGVGAGAGGARLPQAVRIASGELDYSGNLHQALFSGGVHAEMVDGTAVRANEATVYLRPTSGPGQAGAVGGATAPPASAGDAEPSLAGSVERMVATGQVEIEQPGRQATGGRLVYTASDQMFVLTGDGKTQPKLVDAVRGTIVGAALQLHSGDDSVVVTNVEPGGSVAAAGQRVRTDTRVSNRDAAAGKAKR